MKLSLTILCLALIGLSACSSSNKQLTPEERKEIRQQAIGSRHFDF